MQSAAHLFWIDLEMTGLDISRDVILEVASIVTTNNLDIVAEGPSLVIHQPDSALGGMDEWNREQHGKSGLIEAVKRSSVTLEEAYEKTLNFIRQYCVEGKSPLCGNTVSQDKKFLAAYMPDIVRYLHYRLIDVSTVKELVRRWYPHESCAFFDKESNHRAIEDIYGSLEELKHYKKYFFKS